MYNGLNKGIFKSYSKSNLYRGGCLSQEEFDSLMEFYEIQKKSKSSTNKIFFYSRKFLSFSKKEEVANVYLQCAFLMNKGVYVRFVIEGIEEDDFYGVISTSHSSPLIALLQKLLTRINHVPVIEVNGIDVLSISQLTSNSQWEVNRQLIVNSEA